MFNECSSLTNINVSNFNTNNVEDMSNMFCDCNALKEINLKNFNTKNIIHKYITTFKIRETYFC